MPRAVGESVVPGCPAIDEGASRPLAESKSESADTYHGEARRYAAQDRQRQRPRGVSWIRCWLAFRANKDAFDGGNMNRMRSGKILTVPQQAEVEAVSPTEARRSWLLRLPTGTPIAGSWRPPQRAKGRRKTPANRKLRARSPPRSKKRPHRNQNRKTSCRCRAPRAARASLGAHSAKTSWRGDKALKGSHRASRRAGKNVNELQKLLEMKNQNCRVAETKLAAADAKPAPPPVEPVKLAAAAKPAEAPKPAEPAVPPVVAKLPKTETAKDG